MKSIIDDRGKEKTAYDLIREFLRSEGDKTFGDVKSYLAKNSIQYANNMGLDLALKSLIKNGKIGKHKLGKSFPTYYYKQEKINKLATQADEFRRMALDEIIKIAGNNFSSNEEQFVKNFIQIIGLYNMYTQIQSWKFTSKKKSHEENHEIRSIWLRNTLPLGIESMLFEDGITEIAGLKFYNNTKEFDETISEIYKNPKKQNQLKKIEQYLKQEYPEQIKFFEEIMIKLPTSADETSKWIKEMQTFDAWKKRLTRKMVGYTKKLKPKECPRCHYDGSGKVKAGPCKGMKFEKGFTLEPGIEHQGRHCPSCGFWENVKNS